MISAKVIAHSIAASSGKEVVTFELEYPRYIHAELMTHRMFSRNAASSRAIPIEKMVDQVHDNTVMPIWTWNKAGMQGDIVLNGGMIHNMNQVWLEGAKAAIKTAEDLYKLGVHKQNANRVLEPYQHIKTVVTATEWDNWFNLRAHEDAQPEIQALAKEMYAQLRTSEPVTLEDDEWHTPYVGLDETFDSPDTACKISASCCAQVSYRLLDTSEEKALSIYDKLVNSRPIHASPFEHQCRPLSDGEEQRGNLIGFRQLRQDIEDDM